MIIRISKEGGGRPPKQTHFVSKFTKGMKKTWSMMRGHVDKIKDTKLSERRILREVVGAISFERGVMYGLQFPTPLAVQG